MAKNAKKLSKSLQARGVRKRIADTIAGAVSGASKPKVARRAVSDLGRLLSSALSSSG